MAPTQFKSRSPGRSTSMSAELSERNDGPRSRKICSPRRRRSRWNWGVIREWVAWRPNEGRLEGGGGRTAGRMLHRNASKSGAEIKERRESLKKGGRHVA